MATFEEIIKYCADHGKPPSVKYNGTDKFIAEHCPTKEGIVTTIKFHGKHHGVGVGFDGMNFDSWFYTIESTDKRSKYVRDLEIIS